MSVYFGLDVLPNFSIEHFTEYERYSNRIHQIKKEQKLGKHYGSNKVVGKLSRKK